VVVDVPRGGKEVWVVQDVEDVRAVPADPLDQPPLERVRRARRTSSAGALPTVVERRRSLTRNMRMADSSRAMAMKV
jgi:hypothetical protein